MSKIEEVAMNTKIIREAEACFSLASLQKNAEFVIDEVGGLIAVVKNNAYNFGLMESVSAFYKAGVRAFATTSLHDCRAIRREFGDVEVISLNPTYEFDILREENISATLPNMRFLKENCENMGKISWHLEWAGKMRRSGARSIDEIVEMLEFSLEKGLDITGLWTHFSWADEFDLDKTYEKEVEVWLEVVEKLKKIHDFSFIHSQNSASYVRDGLLKGCSHVRLGIYLYGCHPFKLDDSKLDKSSIKRFENIDHALTLSASVIAVNELDAGESIGYCSSFIAKRPTKVAVINVGYGDGILGNRVKGHEVVINSKRYELVSLMMSHMVAIVDDEVKVGDRVLVYAYEIPVHEFTFKGVASNSEQISAINRSSINVSYE